MSKRKGGSKYHKYPKRWSLSSLNQAIKALKSEENKSSIKEEKICRGKKEEKVENKKEDTRAFHRDILYFPIFEILTFHGSFCNSGIGGYPSDSFCSDRIFSCRSLYPWPSPPV